MDDQRWITGEFEGHYMGLPLEASGDVRLYKPKIIRAIVRSPKRTSPIMPAGTDAGSDPFHQDFVPDATVVSESGTAVRVALRDVQVFDWEVPVSTEDHGQTFGRVHGRLRARVVQYGVEEPLLLGAGGTQGGWGGTLARLLPLWAKLTRGCLIYLIIPALLLVALVLLCAQFRGCSGPGEEREETKPQVAGGSGPEAVDTLISADAALADPEGFFASDERRIYLSDATLFAFNSAELAPGGSTELRKVARVLQENRTRRVIIEGYADTIGESAVNQVISEKRAEAVRRWLVEKAGVSPDQVTAVGRGSEKPLVAPTGTAGQQGANRRVEIRPVRTPR